jgi:hypothetical protein
MQEHRAFVCLLYSSSFRHTFDKLGFALQQPARAVALAILARRNELDLIRVGYSTMKPAQRASTLSLSTESSKFSNDPAKFLQSVFKML